MSFTLDLDQDTKKSLRKAREAICLLAALVWLEIRLRLSQAFCGLDHDDFQEEANILIDRYEALYGHPMGVNKV